MYCSIVLIFFGTCLTNDFCVHVVHLYRKFVEYYKCIDLVVQPFLLAFDLGLLLVVYNTYYCLSVSLLFFSRKAIFLEDPEVEVSPAQIDYF